MEILLSFCQPTVVILTKPWLLFFSLARLEKHFVVEVRKFIWF